MSNLDPLEDRPPDPVIVVDDDGNRVSVGGATIREQNAEIRRITTNQTRRQGLASFVEDFSQLINAMGDNHRAYIHSYSDRTWPDEAAPVSEWPQMPTDPDPTSLALAVPWVKRQMAVVVQRQEILRTQLGAVTYAQLREADVFTLILQVLYNQIQRDPTLVPPPHSVPA